VVGAYTLLVALVAVERCLELVISRRNARRLLDRGGVRVHSGAYPWMVALHTGFLLACPLEVWLLERPLVPALAVAMMLLLASALALRYWVMLTLGDRWNTRIIWLPGAPRAVSGPYRWVKHPNYVAVVAELVALPLIHGAWLTALFFSLGNAAVLRVRIRAENDALCRAGS
jgi:methyltransferase